MPDTPIQTPSLINSDLATRQSTILMPTSLPRFEGVISCASPAATPPLNLPERRKKFRKVRLDIHENVTIQIANTPELKHAANEIIQSKYETQGYDTAFIKDPKRLAFTTLTDQLQEAASVRKKLREIVDTDTDRVVWVGRLGFGPAPTARSLRLPLEKLIISSESKK